MAPFGRFCEFIAENGGGPGVRLRKGDVVARAAPRLQWVGYLARALLG